MEYTEEEDYLPEVFTDSEKVQKILQERLRRKRNFRNKSKIISQTISSTLTYTPKKVLGLSKVGNYYAHRYKDKKDSPEEFEYYLNVARRLQDIRQRQKERAQFPFDYNIKVVSISGLLSLLYWTGLRITEIVGDVPHKYMTQYEGEKWTKELHGIRKKDLILLKTLLKVDVKEIRKHGIRKEPLFIPLSKMGVEDIVSAWRDTKNPEDRVFPVSKWLAWKLISDVTEGKFYPHYFRLNRA